MSDTPDKVNEAQKNLGALVPTPPAQKLTAAQIQDLEALDKIIPNWRNKILELAAEGMGEKELRVALCRDANGVFSPNTWITLREREATIQDFFEQAKAISEAWWENKARTMLTHEKGITFETSAWIFNMKNRFNWRDTKPEAVQSLEQTFGNIMQKARARAAELAARKDSEVIEVTHKNKKPALKKPGSREPKK